MPILKALRMTSCHEIEEISICSCTQEAMRASKCEAPSIPDGDKKLIITYYSLHRRIILNMLMGRKMETFRLII
jgi:hypothetical protein